MAQNLQQGEATKMEAYAWATPADGWTLDELISHMRDIGNEVLEIDYENNCIKLMHVEVEL